MLWKKIWTVGGLVALLGLVMSAGGCFHIPTRHGVILRGDWSLELNRAPWLAGRESTYQESSSQPVMLPPDPVVEFSTEVIQPMEEVSPPLEIPRAMGVYESDTSATYDTAPRGPVGFRLLGVLAALRSRFHAAEGPEAVGYYNHPRFHPLPTGPVFAPAPLGEFTPALKPPPSLAPEPLATPEPLPTPAVEPPPEVMPPPAPSPPPPTPSAKAGWERRGSSASVTSKTPSWVFPPPRKRPAPLPPDRYVHTGTSPTVQ